MRKTISLILLGLMCSVGMSWGADFTYALTSFTEVNHTYTYEFDTENKLQNKSAWVEVPSVTSEGTITVKCNGSNSSRWLYIYKTNGTVKDETRKLAYAGSGTWPTAISFTSGDILTDNGKYYVVLGTSDDYKIKGVRYTLSDPSSLVITPEEGIYSGSVEVSMSAKSGYTIYYTDNGDAPTNASTLYSGAFTITNNKTIKAIAYNSSTSSYGFEHTSTFNLVSEERIYDFTSLTADDITALKGNTTDFQDNSTDKIISNKSSWANGTDHAFEGSDGTDVSVASYLFFGRSGSGLDAGKACYYYGDSKYLCFNSGNCYVKIPAVKKDQKVIIEMSAGGDRTVSGTNTTVASISYGKSDKKKLAFIASADGDVKLQVSAAFNLYSIEVKTPHSVTYNLNGGSGTTPTETSKINGEKFTLHDGTTGITAPDGKEFAGWNDGTATYAGGAEYTMGSANVEFTAQWNYAITKGSVTNGSIEVISSAAEGDVVDIEATPDDGYEFGEWSIYKTGDAETTVSPAAATATTTFEMPAYGVTVSATFTALSYPITHSAATNGTYTISVAGGEAVSTNTTAKYGQTITLAASPADGYELDAWNVTKTSGGAAVDMATANTFVMPAEAVTIAPAFRQLTCATPTISPADGSSFSGASQEITLECATDDATIYFTLDGTTPTESSDEYDPADKPVISSTTTVKAIAVKTGYVDSDVATATITKTVSTVWKSWDFTKWGSATITGTGSDTENWYDHEKSDGSGVDFTEGKGAVNKKDVSGTLKYGSTNIAETNGLSFTADAYQMSLVYNVPSALNVYHGSKYIWLFKSSSTITIPSCPANAVIEIGVETHKNTDLRGVTLKNGETTLTQTQGAATSTDYQVCKWTNTSTAGNVVITPSKGLHIYYITVTVDVASVPVSTKAGRNYGSYVTSEKLDFGSAEGITAYIATGLNGAGDAVVLESVGVVPASTPIIVNTESQGATVNVPITTKDADAVNTNKLIAGDGVTAWNGTAGYIYYYLASDQFHYAEEGTLQSGKAYLKVAGSHGAPSVIRIVDEENTATNIETIEAADEGVKFIQNGQLYIKRNGVVYDAMGRIIR